MIQYLQKDLTTVDHGVIAHGCNAQGVMGSGVALALRTKWPQIFDGYKALCNSTTNENRDGSDLLGSVYYMCVNNLMGRELTIANIITQQYYGRTGRKYADSTAILKGLSKVIHYADLLRWPLYIPKIGCGYGGLKWEDDVKPILESLERTAPQVEIFVCDNSEEKWK